MPVFISYSHEDKDFVDQFAGQLVLNKARVWIDRWELKVGDSILQRVQSALTDASALIVVLSRASTESEWCKKEITAGLVRELSEKKVLILPVLIDDCEIPLFLRDKMYADFRKGHDKGICDVLDGIAAVINAEQGRIQDADGTLDWAVDWGFEENIFHLRFTIVQCPKDFPMTFLTEVFVRCNEAATKRYVQYQDAGLDWVGRGVISEMLFEAGTESNLHLLLEDQFVQTKNITIADKRGPSVYSIVVSSRRLGEDNGKIQLISISEYLKDIRAYISSMSRPTTPQEQKRIQEIMNTPFGT
ncbi:MAG TPA: toll/interleukin-1 receptor domain-containing protein [Chitinolyticbacter sp.]|nr:toll/interleukin-1 receptor domain-containing protein [Chitinolyticbacter sp.]